MTPGRNGPHIAASCVGCAHAVGVRYRVQEDSGTDVSCTRSAIGSREVGDTRWDTPAWCPLIVEAADRYLAGHRARLPVATARPATAGIGPGDAAIIDNALEIWAESPDSPREDIARIRALLGSPGGGE